MSVIASALKYMLASGMAHDDILAAVDDMESKLIARTSEEVRRHPQDETSERRREYDRDRKAKKRAEEKAKRPGSPQTSVGHPPEVPNGAYIEPTLSISTEQKEELGGVGAREKSKRGTRMSRDWCLPHELYLFAKSEGMLHDAIGREAQKFRDHFLAAAGSRGVKLDWDATWRNWIRNNLTGYRRNGRGKSSDIADAFDIIEARLPRRDDFDPEDDGRMDFTDSGGGMPGFAGRLL